MALQLQPRPDSLYKGNKKIILLGEGDFSFALSLARHHNSGDNILATSFDGEAFLHAAYGEAEGDAKGNIAELRSLGVTVLHDFDATTLHSEEVDVIRCFVGLVKKVVIVWNFPHPGWPSKASRPMQTTREQPYRRVRESDQIMINRHRKLLRKFFISASPLAQSTDCTIHVTTVVSRQDADKWDVHGVGLACGYARCWTHRFVEGDYPGYARKIGVPNDPNGKRVGNNFGNNNAVTSVFKLEQEGPLIHRCFFEAIVTAMRKHMKSEGMQRHACFSLRGPAGFDAENRARAGSVDAVATVVAAMRAHTASAGVQEGACAALWNLTNGSADNRIRAGIAGAIKAVVRAMRGHTSSETMQWNACSALWNITSYNAANQTRAGDEGAIEAVVAAMCGHTGNAKLQQSACIALNNMTFRNAENVIRAENAGAAEAVIAALRGHANDEAVQKWAWKALLKLPLEIPSETWALSRL